MKYVLRHQLTGRYLSRPGLWVRRMDEAMSFDDVGEAREFSQAHQLDEARPVQLLMPYLMSLLAAAPGRIGGEVLVELAGGEQLHESGARLGLELCGRNRC